MKHTLKHSYLLFFTLICLFCFTGCETKAIINGIQEKEANEILVILASKGIIATKTEAVAATGSKEVLYNIIVSGNDGIQAMAILNQYGLPRQKGLTLLDIFSASGLVPSESEEKIRYHAGLESQLSTIIRKIDGVIDANVQLSIPEKNTLDPNPIIEKAHASIFVKHQGILDDPNSHLTTKIKRLVANSVPNLDYEDVSVIPFKARYAEISLDDTGKGSHKEYVRVWSVVVAKESLSTFRVIFFLFIIFILLFMSTTGWLIWKHLPVLKEEGWKTLLRLKPSPIKKNDKESAAAADDAADDDDDDDYDFDEDEEQLLGGDEFSKEEEEEEDKEDKENKEK